MMPNATIYIKKKDLIRWQSISNKSDFIHRVLNGLSPNVVTLKKGTHKVQGATVIVADGTIRAVE